MLIRLGLARRTSLLNIKKPWRDKWSKVKEAMRRRGVSEKAIEYVEARYLKVMEDGVTWRDPGE